MIPFNTLFKRKFHRKQVLYVMILMKHLLWLSAQNVYYHCFLEKVRLPCQASRMVKFFAGFLINIIWFTWNYYRNLYYVGPYNWRAISLSIIHWNYLTVFCLSKRAFNNWDMEVGSMSGHPPESVFTEMSPLTFGCKKALDVNGNTSVSEAWNLWPFDCQSS